MAGALAGLHVLEGDVVDRGVVAMGMVDVLEHLARRGPDVDFVRRASDAAHQAARLLERARRVANPGIV